MLKRVLMVLSGVMIAAFMCASGGSDSIVNYYIGEKIQTEDLGGDERFSTYLSTDKPIYRINDDVYIRGLLLRSDSNIPHSDYVNGVLQVIGSRGDKFFESMVTFQSGIMGTKWKIPQNLGGGEYLLKINYFNNYIQYPPTERKIRIRAYRPPRLKTDIQFFKDGYSPGETVKAMC